MKTPRKRTSRRNLPDNCSIEFFEDEGTFRLVFETEGEPYLSEIYGIGEGETLQEAARAVCRRFAWNRRPPG